MATIMCYFDTTTVLKNNNCKSIIDPISQQGSVGSWKKKFSKRLIPNPNECFNSSALWECCQFEPKTQWEEKVKCWLCGTVCTGQSTIWHYEVSTGVSKKCNTFDLEYLKDGSTKLIVLLVCYLVLPYNSIDSHFSFLWLSEAKILSFKV